MRFSRPDDTSPRAAHRLGPIDGGDGEVETGPARRARVRRVVEPLVGHQRRLLTGLVLEHDGVPMRFLVDEHREHLLSGPKRRPAPRFHLRSLRKSKRQPADIRQERIAVVIRPRMAHADIVAERSRRAVRCGGRTSALSNLGRSFGACASSREGGQALTSRLACRCSGDNDHGWDLERLRFRSVNRRAEFAASGRAAATRCVLRVGFFFIAAPLSVAERTRSRGSSESVASPGHDGGRAVRDEPTDPIDHRRGVEHLGVLADDEGHGQADVAELLVGRRRPRWDAGPVEQRPEQEQAARGARPPPSGGAWSAIRRRIGAGRNEPSIVGTPHRLRPRISRATTPPGSKTARDARRSGRVGREVQRDPPAERVSGEAHTVEPEPGQGFVEPDGIVELGRERDTVLAATDVAHDVDGVDVVVTERLDDRSPDDRGAQPAMEEHDRRCRAGPLVTARSEPKDVSMSRATVGATSEPRAGPPSHVPGVGLAHSAIPRAARSLGGVLRRGVRSGTGGPGTCRGVQASARLIACEQRQISASLRARPRLDLPLPGSPTNGATSSSEASAGTVAMAHTAGSPAASRRGTRRRSPTDAEIRSA